MPHTCDDLEYLESIIPRIFSKLGINTKNNYDVIIDHADKYRQYFDFWAENGLLPIFGGIIYLISRTEYYTESDRQNINEWVLNKAPILVPTILEAESELGLMSYRPICEGETVHDLFNAG